MTTLHQAINNELKALSPASMRKVLIYAQTLHQIEDQQQEQRQRMMERIIEQLPKLNDSFLRDTMVVADTLLDIQREGGNSHE